MLLYPCDDNSGDFSGINDYEFCGYDWWFFIWLITIG